MATLLLRLAGPMQAWGTDSKLGTRNTTSCPSKSGVIGMVAAAMGRSREDPVDDLSALRFGVRIDQAGEALRDYHTARRLNPHTKSEENLAYVTERYYISDAVFLVGLEGDADMLRIVDEAVRNPYYPLFLGRRSCPATGKVSLGVKDSGLEDALDGEPWLASEWYRCRMPQEVSLDFEVESANPGEGYLVRDRPISFSQSKREYGFRSSAHRSGAPFPNECSRYRENPTKHDPFADAGGDSRCTYPESS